MVADRRRSHAGIDDDNQHADARMDVIAKEGHDWLLALDSGLLPQSPKPKAQSLFGQPDNLILQRLERRPDIVGGLRPVEPAFELIGVKVGRRLVVGHPLQNV